MKLEQQVINIELSKRLNELGINKPSLFYWKYTQGRGNDSIQYTEGNIPEDNIYCEWYSAYTVAELGQMLPKEESIVTMIFTNSRCQMAMLGYEWKDKSIGQSIEADTEADARAKMLIYLLENNLIK